MVIPFFGRKPTDDKPAAPDKGGRDAKDPTTSLLEFTQVGGGRALAAAADKIQVSEAVHEDNAAIEEAAVLYANANAGGARAVLEGAIDTAGDKASEALWAMLFDLYRIVGDKGAFEARGVKFAEQFEISPPIWDEADAQAATGALPARDASPAVNLTGNLSGSARPQFDQLLRIAAKMGKMRIDLSRVRGIDDAGGELLAEMLQNLKRSRVQVVLLGANHALGLVMPRLKAGEKTGQSFWLLALALIQQVADAERFDQVALDYAITFEESPPSYEPPPALPAAEAAALKAVEEEAPRDDFIMEGEVTGNQPEVLRRLAAYAAQRSAVTIDASKLKRLEFVSAGSLFNQIAQLQGQGKLTVIRHPNALVGALLRVMGVDQIAQIETKRRV